MFTVHKFNTPHLQLRLLNLPNLFLLMEFLCLLGSSLLPCCQLLSKAGGTMCEMFEEYPTSGTVQRGWQTPSHKGVIQRMARNQG